jgi:foldase protein PrsA
VSKNFRGAAVLFVVLAAMLMGCGGGGLPSDGVGKVGSVVITRAQLDERVKQLQASYAGQVPTKESDPAAFKTFEAQVVDYLVTLQMVKQKAPGLKVTVTDEEIQTQIDQIKTQYGGDETKFQDALKKQNLTLDSLKKSLGDELLIQKVADAVTKNTSDASVPDAALQAYYDQNKASFKVAEARTIRHILFGPKTAGSTTTTTAAAPGATTTTTQPTQAELDAALTLAQKVRQQLVKGGDFAALAKQYSDDSGSKLKGGNLGSQPKGAMVPEFDTVAWSLKLNEISLPVKTQYGYHLIQVTAITPAREQTFAEVKAQIKTRLLDTKKSKIWDAWLVATKKELKVVYKVGMEPPASTTTTTPVPGGATGTTSAGGTGGATSSDTSGSQPATTTTSK